MNKWKDLFVAIYPPYAVFNFELKYNSDVDIYEKIKINTNKVYFN